MNAIMIFKWGRKFFSIFLIVFCVPASVIAQSEQGVAPAHDPTSKWDYAAPEIANTARTYWAFNKFKVNDEKALENFLKLTECRFFNEKYGDDFAWKKILRHTGQYIQTNLEKFPFRYTFSQPISLGRYDFERNGFPLAEDSTYEGLRDLEIGIDIRQDDECDNIRFRNIQGYPTNMAFEFKRPFSLTFFPLAERYAKDYLNYVESKLGDTKYKRPAYIKFYVRASKFVGETYFQNTGNRPLALFIGELEKYEIYADRDMRHLLYTHIPAHIKQN